MNISAVNYLRWEKSISSCWLVSSCFISPIKNSLFQSDRDKYVDSVFSRMNFTNILVRINLTVKLILFFVICRPNVGLILYHVFLLHDRALKQQGRFFWRIFLFGFFLFKTYNYSFFHINLVFYITKIHFRHKLFNKYC